MQPEFSEYIKNVIVNTNFFVARMKELGAVCSETENHLMLLNTKETFGITGLEAQQLLESINIACNKNMLPNDTETPKTTSGLRIGFAATTTRGIKPEQVIQLADIIYCYLKTYKCVEVLHDKEHYRKKVAAIIKKLKKV